MQPGNTGILGSVLTVIGILIASVLLGCQDREPFQPGEDSGLRNAGTESIGSFFQEQLASSRPADIPSTQPLDLTTTPRQSSAKLVQWKDLIAGQEARLVVEEALATGSRVVEVAVGTQRLAAAGSPGRSGCHRRRSSIVIFLLVLATQPVVPASTPVRSRMRSHPNHSATGRYVGASWFGLPFGPHGGRGARRPATAAGRSRYPSRAGGRSGDFDWSGMVCCHSL